ncbi:MAG: hypothetical protein J6Y47_05420, partial [Bacteroidales bacterium]|nr:hypothetical protein [Bacteroidales bacterium]
MKVKNFILLVSMVLMSATTLFAQAPQGFTYQAVVRNSKGQLVSNTPVGVKISILQGSSSGVTVYSDTYTPQTNANGLFSIIIGSGMNSINTIDWAQGPYYLKSEVDPDGGNNYTLNTVQQLLSTPYALYAQTAGLIKNLPNPTDSTDAVNLRTVINLLGNITHRYDSLINDLNKTIDSLRQNIDTTSGGGYSIGVFSVSATDSVLFSPGNLQWSATNGGNTATTHAVADSGTAAGTWRFASNQWNMIGAANSNVSSTYTGWIDLFGWGTSGYNNKYPYMTSTTHSDYGNGNNNIAGTNYDWGVYNAIYNPKTQTTDAPGTWRTLTKDEWVYLLNTRPTASSIRYAKATVCGIVGLIIVPDNCSNTYYPLTNVNTAGAAYTSNIIGATDWAKMENVGCVFLPAAG